MLIERGRVTSYELQPGRRIGQPYVVVQLLGSGVEGEVYQILETDTGIYRAAKLYFPHCNPTGRTSRWLARKLDKLRHCPIVLQYQHIQEIQIARQKVLCLVSELAPGTMLEDWIARQRGGRLAPYAALHLFYRLVRGLETVHAVGEYHGDVHSQNIMVQPIGIGFHLKLIDFYNWGPHTRGKQREDIVDAITVFHEILGGKRHYARQGPEVRHICAGLQATRILKRFPTMSALRNHLETFEWTRLA